MGDSQVPFRLRDAPSLLVAPPGYPPDVAPNQVIFAAHINAIRDSVARWPGDVDGQNHTLTNVHLGAGVTGVMIDPTTTAGDLIARGASAIERLGVGANGQVLTVDTSLAGKLKWAAPAVNAVTSVFTRTGAVTAQSGDYTAAMVTNAVSTLGSYGNPAWITSLAWNKITDPPVTFPPSAHQHNAGDVITGVFATARLGTGVADATVYLRGDGTWAAVAGGGGGAVTSVFGRAGTVVAQAGDYTAAQVGALDAAIVTARGDLITRTLSAVTRLPVGADGQALVADSSAAAGIKWAPVSGSWIDPTTTRGDMLVNDGAGITRLEVGTDTYVLTADSSAANGVRWAAAAGGAGAVASVFGRTGAVVAVSGDYNAAQVLNAVDQTQTYANPAWITSLSFTKLTGVPAYIADPTTAKGDLLVRGESAPPAALPVGANGMVLTADSAQLLGVKWAPAAGGGSQTPWTSDIDGANFKLNNAGAIGVGAAAPANGMVVLGGNVGIGTSAPSGALEVNAYQRWAVFASNTGGVLPPNQQGIFLGWNYSNGTGEANFAYNGNTGLSIVDTFGGVWNERARIDSTGRVGVKTPLPQAQLDVNGSIRTMGVNTVPFGAGLEMSYDSGIGVVGVVDHDAGQYKNAHIRSNLLILNQNQGVPPTTASGFVIIRAPSSAPDGGLVIAQMPQQSIVFYLDEAGSKLMVKCSLSGGAIKVGSITIA